MEQSEQEHSEREQSENILEQSSPPQNEKVQQFEHRRELNDDEVMKKFKRIKHQSKYILKFMELTAKDGEYLPLIFNHGNKRVKIVVEDCELVQ